MDLTTYNLGNNHSKTIYCYAKNGDFLNEYKSQSEASSALGVAAGLIRESCLTFCLVKNKYYFLLVKENNYSEAKTKYLKQRPVYQYDSNGNFLKEYLSEEIAIKETNVNIDKAIRLKSQDENGNYWSIEKLPIFNAQKNKKRKVGKFDINGKLLNTYDSATAAAKENGTSV